MSKVTKTTNLYNFSGKFCKDCKYFNHENTLKAPLCTAPDSTFPDPVFGTSYFSCRDMREGIDSDGNGCGFDGRLFLANGSESVGSSVTRFFGEWRRNYTPLICRSIDLYEAYKSWSKTQECIVLPDVSLTKFISLIILTSDGILKKVLLAVPDSTKREWFIMRDGAQFADNHSDGGTAKH